MSNAISVVQTDSVIVSLMRASTALVEAKTIQHTMQIVSLAAAAEIWAKRQQLGAEAEGIAFSIKVEALRSLGEMLKAAPKATGSAGRGRPKIGGYKSEPPKSAATLADLGLDKRTSVIAQKLAELPDAAFEQVREGNETISKALAKAKADKDAQAGKVAAKPQAEAKPEPLHHSTRLTKKELAEVQAEAMGGTELVEDHERLEIENRHQAETIKALSATDKDKQIEELLQRVYGLEGRNRQLMASEKAAVDKLQYMTDLVHKLRKIFGVDTHKEIIAAAQAMVA